LIKSLNSWPFLEPVTEELAPNYFTIIENPIDLSTIQQKINNKIYVNNSAEFIRDIELMVANCEQYNGKRSILGRLANRLLHYFKECWSECQPITPQFDDDLDHMDNPLRKSTIITRDKNNNTKTRKNYRQLAGLSDDEDESEYIPIQNSKRARHSAPPHSSVPIYITLDPNSPAYIVYHDHSYFIRHETTNSSIDNTQKRKSQIQDKSTLPTVQALNKLLLEHQQKTKNSQINSSTTTTTTTTPLDFTAILRALLVKQGHHLTNDNTPSPPSSTAAS